jgi:uncharacterized membrane protein
LVAHPSRKRLTFVQSTSTIGSYWNAHHRTFRHIERYAGRFVLLNLVASFCITFLPATSALVGDYFDEPAAVTI